MDGEVVVIAGYIMAMVAIAIFLAIFCGSIVLFYRSIRSFIGKQYWKGSWQLLVSIVLGVLILASIPCGNSDRMGESARRAACANNIKQTILFLKMYANDHQDAHPSTYTELVGTNYIIAGSSDLTVFVCPSCLQSGSTMMGAVGNSKNIHEWTDYAYVSGLTENDPSNSVVMFCPPQNHKGRGANVGFLGGRVEWFSCKPTPASTQRHPIYTFQELTNTPSLFYGTTNVVVLADLLKRTRIIWPKRKP